MRNARAPEDQKEFVKDIIMHSDVFLISAIFLSV